MIKSRNAKARATRKDTQRLGADANNSPKTANVAESVAMFQLPKEAPKFQSTIKNRPHGQISWPRQITSPRGVSRATCYHECSFDAIRSSEDQASALPEASDRESESLTGNARGFGA